jgi:RNA polymerase sigma factor (sigma-70 family)
MVCVSDAHLIAKARDHQSFTELYERHKAWTAAICRSFQRDWQDLHQHVWLRIYEEAGADTRKPRSWIAKVAFSACLRYTREPHHAVDVDECPVTYDDDLRPDEQAERNEEYQKVREIVASLPHGRLLAMHYFDGLSYREIAAKVGVSIGAVEQRISRAKKNFRRKWGDRAN